MANPSDLFTHDPFDFDTSDPDTQVRPAACSTPDVQADKDLCVSALHLQLTKALGCILIGFIEPMSLCHCSRRSSTSRCSMA